MITCKACGAPVVLDMDAEPMYSDPRIDDFERQLAYSNEELVSASKYATDLERQLAEAKAEIEQLRNILRSPYPEHLVIRMSHQDNHIEKRLAMEEALMFVGRKAEHMLAALRDYEARKPK